jgi:hypothetical protein
MSDLQFLPLQPHDFDSLPDGFEYEHYISSTSNTSAFDTAVDNRDLESCVVCGGGSAGGPRPSVARAHVIEQAENILVGYYFLFQLNESQFHVVGLPEDERLCSVFR